MEDVLRVENLSSGYEQKTVLNQINFGIKKGEMVGIIGPNGSGKSTLLKTVRGMLPPQSGQVYLFGKAISGYSENQIARHVAYLQQNVNVSFGYTAKDIVMTGRYPYLKWWQGEEENDEAIAELCMQYTGVFELADTPVNNVSGGQKQRIFLAKVLAQQTPLLFLDEPTTGLDFVYQEEILRFCKCLCDAGKTILTVLHELSLAAKYCSRFILIGNGGIVAQGVPAAVLTDAILTETYHVPVHVMRNPLNGNFELCTSFSEEANAKQNALINLICDGIK